MPKIKLENEKEVKVDVIYDEKEVKAFNKCKPITVKKKITTIRIKNSEGVVDFEATASCSHLDQFVKFEGRKEAFKKLIETAGKKLSRNDRRIISKAIGII